MMYHIQVELPSYWLRYNERLVYVHIDFGNCNLTIIIIMIIIVYIKWLVFYMYNILHVFLVVESLKKL